MSQLLDRYLFAVGSQLPAKSRADITAELRDVLMNRSEEREEALGRAMTPDEEARMLKDFGHPLVVAGGYQRHQQLIGPTIYPFYVFTLKVVLGVMLAIWLVVLILDIAGMHGAPFDRIDNSLVGGLVFAFGAVTLVMAIIERAGGAEKMIAAWNPRTLPLVQSNPGNRRFETAFETAFSAAFVLWWIGLIHFPPLNFPVEAGARIAVALSPVWNDFFWPILGLCLAQIAVSLFELIRPDKVRVSAALRLVYLLAVVGLVALLARAGALAVVTTSGLSAERAAHLVDGVDLGMKFILWGNAAAAGVQLIKAGWRFWRSAGPA